MINVQGLTQICLKQIHFSFYPLVTGTFQYSQILKMLVKRRDTVAHRDEA